MKPISLTPRPGFFPGCRQVMAAALLACLAGAFPARAQTPNTGANIERPLRYRPDGQDFLIENGTAQFNRPLYGPHTAFRVDASDRPDFAFYTGGKGGRLRLGFVSPKGSQWLDQAQRVIARYRPGSMVYDVVDAAIGDGALKVTALPLKETEGLILCLEVTRGAPVDFVWAFGGASGAAVNERGGDLLGGRDPGQAWNFQPEDYAGACKITGATFDYRGKGPAMSGVGPAEGRLLVGDAAALSTVDGLLASKGGDHPAAVGRITVRGGQPAYLLIQRSAGGKVLPGPEGLPFAYKLAERARQAIVGQLSIETPDPFINASADAIAVSADALWQAPTVMHGNVAWRQPLLGWRGPYVLDELGWHDRARQHFEYWAARQNPDEKDTPAPHADPAKNLAEDDGKALHGYGSIPANHYDMNLVFIDALLRHLLWTGDLDLARQMWPVIQRHLAYEKRLFDRDGLYEGYAAIWASDGLGYDGGGAAHATAYNLWHNRMAARLARLIGQDPAPYDQEAKWIADAMQHDLWLPATGSYAEYKDTLGYKRVHPDAALWTVYHAIDSQVPDAFQAYQALRYVDTQIAHIPVKGPGVPAGDWYVLPTSNWQPYEWSLNNVVPAELAHTALANWQGGRPDEAWKLWKGMILDAMYLGTSPGNLPNLSQYDVYRRETYRDFGDTTGMTARGLVEGLFGIVPDALAGELTIRPGFPREWSYASIRTPDLSFSYRLDNSQSERFIVEPKFPKPMRLRLRSLARGERVAAVLVNGKPAQWSSVPDAVGTPAIEVVTTVAATRYEVNIRWVGGATVGPRPMAMTVLDRTFRMDFSPANVLEVFDPQNALKSAAPRDKELVGTANGLPGWHTVFAKVKQDDLTWWMPVDFEIRLPLQIIPSPNQDAQSVRFKVRNNTTTAIERWATVEVGGHKSTVTMKVPALGDSGEIVFPAEGLLPGTIKVRVDLAEGGVASENVVNWQIAAPEGTTWRQVDLTSTYNDPVAQIFRNDYATPRPATVSLQVPRQGLGTWDTFSRTFAVDDSGLRRAAGQPGGFALPSGVKFLLPSQPGAKNAAFASLWDNYPKELSFQVSGRASHAYLLMTGTTNPLQTQIDNGEVIVSYWDGTSDRLALRNPSNWAPIERDYFTDDFAFQVPNPRPPRVELGTGKLYEPEATSRPAGGAATVLDLPLDPSKQLFSLTIKPLSNEVVIGLLGLTLAR
ncbi:MAG TPA: DUF4450 domain-containing protein [Opitutaceae bacterium]|nr:DUF4450 domain-containing protein [Opitutaceae bacterium]